MDYDEYKESCIKEFRGNSPQKLIGTNDEFCKALFRAARFSLRDDPIIIVGETGTGKEWLAQAIHSNSLRKGKTLLAVNCALFRGDLLISQLFGHRKGAFTGAINDHNGFFESADKGTLLLDEIQEIPREFQGMLLRVIESGTFTPLGTTEVIKTDVRIIATAKPDLEKRIRAGEFTLDLANRFSFQIDLPPLRERPEDIPLLAKEILAEIDQKKYLPESTLQYLTGRQWYGNLRELRNTILVTTMLLPPGQDRISPGDIQVSKISLEQKSPEGEPTALDVVALAAAALIKDPTLNLKKLSDQIIQETLKRFDNINDAAKCLGISDRTIRNRLRQPRGKI